MQQPRGTAPRVKTYTVPDKPRPVSVLDLSVEQVEAIEEEVGVPINLWGSRGSSMKVYRLVLAAGNGTDPDAFSAMTVRDLKALVSMSDPEADEASDPDR